MVCADSMIRIQLYWRKAERSSYGILINDIFMGVFANRFLGLLMHKERVEECVSPVNQSDFLCLGRTGTYFAYDIFNIDELLRWENIGSRKISEDDSLYYYCNKFDVVRIL